MIAFDIAPSFSLQGDLQDFLQLMSKIFYKLRGVKATQFSLLCYLFFPICSEETPAEHWQTSVNSGFAFA